MPNRDLIPPFPGKPGAEDFSFLRSTRVAFDDPPRSLYFLAHLLQGPEEGHPAQPIWLNQEVYHLPLKELHKRVSGRLRDAMRWASFSKWAYFQSLALNLEKPARELGPRIVSSDKTLGELTPRDLTRARSVQATKAWVEAMYARVNRHALELPSEQLFNDRFAHLYGPLHRAARRKWNLSKESADDVVQMAYEAAWLQFNGRDSLTPRTLWCLMHEAASRQLKEFRNRSGRWHYLDANLGNDEEAGASTELGFSPKTLELCLEARHDWACLADMLGVVDMVTALDTAPEKILAWMGRRLLDMTAPEMLHLWERLSLEDILDLILFCFAERLGIPQHQADRYVARQPFKLCLRRRPWKRAVGYDSEASLADRSFLHRKADLVNRWITEVQDDLERRSFF